MNDDGNPIPPAGGQAADPSQGAPQQPVGGQQAGGGHVTDPAQGGAQQAGTGQAAQPVAGGAQVQAGDQDAAAPATTPAAEGEENFLRPRPPDSELGIGEVGEFHTSITVPAHPNTTFDEVYFLKMLSGSISLTKNEKKKIVESISKLSQFQIDELIKIFEEERRKFAELDEKHQVKIRELQNKQQEDWKDLEMAEQQAGKSEEDAAAAEALKAQLMGGGDAPQAPAADQQPPSPSA